MRLQEKPVLRGPWNAPVTLDTISLHETVISLHETESIAASIIPTCARISLQINASMCRDAPVHRSYVLASEERDLEPSALRVLYPSSRVHIF